ncbi:AGAP011129-PA, partial [Anopheles gambiae str. PEST]
TPLAPLPRLAQPAFPPVPSPVFVASGLLDKEKQPDHPFSGWFRQCCVVVVWCEILQLCNPQRR